MNEPGRGEAADILPQQELPPVTNEFTPLFYNRDRLSHPFNNEASRLEEQYLDIFYVYVGDLLQKAMSSGQEMFDVVNDALADGVSEAMQDVQEGTELLNAGKFTFEGLPLRLRRAMKYTLERRKEYQRADDETKNRLAKRAFMTISQRFSDYMLDIREDLRSVVLINLIGNGFLGEDARKKLDFLDFQASLRSDPKLGATVERVSPSALPENTPVETAPQNAGSRLMSRVRSLLRRS